MNTIIKYRKNENWDIVKIPIKKYNKKDIVKILKRKVKLLKKEKIIKAENYIVDIVETIPTKNMVVVQFVLIKM